MSGFLRGMLRRERAWLDRMRLQHPWIESRDLAMMRRALDLARSAAAAGEVPVGAVIYRENEIVAEAANDREATRDPAGHDAGVFRIVGWLSRSNRARCAPVLW